MATATNDKPVRLGDLPVVKTNILENAGQMDKGVVGGYNGAFPLTAASKGGIYLLPSTGKFYVCETAYNGAQISAPNSNFVELSVWKNHDRLTNLYDNKWIRIFSKRPDEYVYDCEFYLFKISNFVFISGQFLIKDIGCIYNCKVPNDFLPKEEIELRGQVITRNDRVFTNAINLQVDGSFKNKTANSKGEIVVFSFIYQTK